jgi:hypothetical protein
MVSSKIQGSGQPTIRTRVSFAGRELVQPGKRQQSDCRYRFIQTVLGWL